MPIEEIDIEALFIRYHQLLAELAAASRGDFRVLEVLLDETNLGAAKIDDPEVVKRAVNIMRKALRFKYGKELLDIHSEPDVEHGQRIIVYTTMSNKNNNMLLFRQCRSMLFKTIVDFHLLNSSEFEEMKEIHDQLTFDLNDLFNFAEGKNV